MAMARYEKASGLRNETFLHPMDGFRLVLFYRNRWGILRTLRAELMGFYLYLPDAEEAIESVVPIFPYFYWQFKL